MMFVFSILLSLKTTTTEGFMNKKCLTGSHRFLRYFVLSSLAFFLFAQCAVAQSQFATITGLIVDSSGGSIPGADVTITNEQTGVQTKTVTNGDGNYTTASLIPGTYILKGLQARL